VQLKSSITFARLEGEKFSQRPRIFNFLQGFHTSMMMPEIQAFLIPGEDGSGNYGVYLMYRNSGFGIKRAHNRFFTMCNTLGNCLIPQSSSDVYSEMSGPVFEGLHPIGTVLIPGDGKRDFNYGFNVNITKPFKYFGAGMFLAAYRLFNSTFSYRVLNRTSRSFFYEIETSKMSKITSTRMFYIGSTEGTSTISPHFIDSFQIHFVNFTSFRGFSSAFANSNPINSLNVTIPYNPTSDISGAYVSQIWFTRWFCSNSPLHFGLNSSFISANNTHAIHEVTVYGNCNLESLEGYMLIFSAEYRNIPWY
jgi:hypothetical protein